jgi:RNA polymerase sigma-70 factor (ECF subfamily)
MWDVQDLFQRHGKELTRFLRRRVSSPEIAADLAQDAFLALMTARPANGVANGHAYLFRTAINLAINHNRRERILAFVEDSETVLATVEDEAPSPERILLSRQELALLQATLNEFPPTHRAIFVLSRIEGRTYEEIGRLLDISSKTVFSHMVRMLVRMQLRLKDARK